MIGIRMLVRVQALVTLAACLALGCATETDRKTERQLALSRMASELHNPDRAPSVKLVDRTIEHVRDAYYDKQRVDPPAMVVAAMEAVAMVVPLLRVEQIAPGKLQLSSGVGSQVFDLKVASSLEVAVLFNQMHGYLTGPLQLQDESRIMGFAAANGLLSTLDPECALISEEEFVTRSSASEDLPPEKLMVLWPTGSDLYLRLGVLPLGTSRVLERVLEGVSSGIAGRLPPRGLILDLRGNPGGLFEEALRVTGVFVESGISTRAPFGGGWTWEHRSQPPRTRWRGPMVVLVDERTASGAEVIAGTLKDLDRAPLIGPADRWGGNHPSSVRDSRDRWGVEGLPFPDRRHGDPANWLTLAEAGRRARPFGGLDRGARSAYQDP
jgi:hypothetical protein